MKSTLFILFAIVSMSCFAQRQDRIWCLADSAGVDFNDTATPIHFNSFLGSDPTVVAGNHTSIADKNSGNLLFYASGIAYSLNYGGRVFNRNFNTMLNGDSMRLYPGIYPGSLIIPIPGDSMRYYLFHFSPQGGYVFSYYSIIDMSLDAGLGGVTTKNLTLDTSAVNEKIAACKHANGRDWWLLLQATRYDAFLEFLITPNGIQGPFFKIIGSPNNPLKFFGNMLFSKNGDKLVLVSPYAYVDIFDFDRCTGDLNNYRNAGEQIFSQHNGYVGCSISPNGNVLYATTNYYAFKNVYQYDLTSPNIISTKQIVFSYQDTGTVQYLSFGAQLLAADNKIYIAKGNANGPNSYTINTHHLDAILNPDSLGTACNYQSNYLDLGSGRTLGGLPVMVNYNLGPDSGSVCDSLHVGINEITEKENLIEMFPNPTEGFFSLSLKDVGDHISKVRIEDILGNEILFLKNFSSVVDLTNAQAGIYFVHVFTQKGKNFVAKLIKE